MAEESVTATAVNGKGSDGGILERQLIGDIKETHLFLEGLFPWLRFIMDGLSAEEVAHG